MREPRGQAALPPIGSRGELARQKVDVLVMRGHRRPTENGRRRPTVRCLRGPLSSGLPAVWCFTKDWKAGVPGLRDHRVTLLPGFPVPGQVLVEIGKLDRREASEVQRLAQGREPGLVVAGGEGAL